MGLVHDPHPDPEAVGEDAELVERLRAEIAAEGPITFARFMERALYEPGHGYYRRPAAGPGFARRLRHGPGAAPDLRRRDRAAARAGLGRDGSSGPVRRHRGRRRHGCPRRRPARRPPRRGVAAPRRDPLPPGGTRGSPDRRAPGPPRDRRPGGSPRRRRDAGGPHRDRRRGRERGPRRAAGPPRRRPARRPPRALRRRRGRPIRLGRGRADHARARRRASTPRASSSRTAR